MNFKRKTPDKGTRTEKRKDQSPNKKITPKNTVL
jgi:hypothetical protein